MSLAQIAKLVTKVAKSPMGKLGMAAIAGGAVASIFSGCKKEPDPIHTNVGNQISIDSTLVHQLDSLLHELDSVVHP